MEITIKLDSFEELEKLKKVFFNVPKDVKVDTCVCNKTNIKDDFIIKDDDTFDSVVSKIEKDKKSIKTKQIHKKRINKKSKKVSKEMVDESILGILREYDRLSSVDVFKALESRIICNYNRTLFRLNELSKESKINKLSNQYDKRKVDWCINSSKINKNVVKHTSDEVFSF